MSDYEFTADWFSQNIPTWQNVLRRQWLKPRKVLEIGSYEGKSTTWIVENMIGPDGGEVYCIDTWTGGLEHAQSEMPGIEARFDNNIAISIERFPSAIVHKLKGPSALMLAKLLADGHGSSFDFVYVDGSHEAPDVFTDLALSFALCRINGVIACDDYMWDFGRDPLLTPKIAIDAFVNCHTYKLRIILAWLYQLYILKIKD